MDTSLTATPRDMARHDIIQRFIRKKISVGQAAARLHLSVRQVERLRNKVETCGVPGLIHGNRGRPSNRRMSDSVVKDMERLVRSNYLDFGPTFAAEKLREVHGIAVSRETLRALMTSWGLWTARSRRMNGEYRAWRERKASPGELVQFDGSYHAWFENRAPACCLLTAIDDATGKIMRLLFTDWEGVAPSFAFWRGYVETLGKPCALYLDRHSTYQVNTKALLDDPEARTQFERAMHELEIEVIHAYSPQAKGRVERLFGTLQDRLVKELRLAGIVSREDANRFVAEVFLPAFNERFAVVPKKEGDLHRSLIEEERARLDRIFSVRDVRAVTNDFTIRFRGQWLQLGAEQPTLVCRRDRVEVEERRDGSLHLFFRGRYLSFSILPERPPKIAERAVTALTRERPRWVPPLDHPWRRPFLRQPSKAETVSQ